MFGIEPRDRMFVCSRPVSMRKGIDGLFNLVVSESPLLPTDGDLFVFFSASRNACKVLRWVGDGFLLYHRRLSEGTFEFTFSDTPGYAQMPWSTFSLIMEGISLDSVRRRKRYVRAPVPR